MEYEHEDGRMDAQRSGSAFLAGLLAGTAIGAGLGLLFAPSPGPQLRKQVRDSASSAGKEMSKVVDGFTTRGRHVYESARDVASKAGEKINGIANKATEAWPS